jgi:hypothetical protein
MTPRPVATITRVPLLSTLWVNALSPCQSDTNVRRDSTVDTKLHTAILGCDTALVNAKGCKLDAAIKAADCFYIILQS